MEPTFYFKDSKLFKCFLRIVDVDTDGMFQVELSGERELGRLWKICDERRSAAVQEPTVLYV